MLHDFLEHRARQHPDALFAIEGERRQTYGQALAEVERLANALIRSGLESGDRIAVVAKNSIEFALLYFAASKAGGVLVPLNYGLAPTELAALAADASVKVLFVGREFVSAFGELRPRLTGVETFVVLDGVGTEGWVDLPRFVADTGTSSVERSTPAQADLLICYTSGTTGRPKGVILTQQGVVDALLHMALEFRGATGDRWLIALPIFHAAVVTYTVMQCVVSGGCMIVHREFRISEMVKALAEDSVAFALTSSMIIREIVRQLLTSSERPHFPALRALIYGAAPIGNPSLEPAMSIFDGKLIQVYGTTEASGITILTPQDHQRARRDRPALSASGGRPGLATEIRIVDRKGCPLPRGERGEVVAKSPSPMRGYWRRPEATSEALRDGWIRTGDLGYLDEEGYLYVEGRVIDTIVSNGHSVYPFEVEAVLRQHSAIAEVAVVGVPHPEFGEAVKAVAVLRADASASARDLHDLCAEKLEAFKRPLSVDFVATLPKNAFGRVLKRELRASFWPTPSS